MPNLIWYHELDLSQIVQEQVSRFDRYITSEVVLRVDYSAVRNNVFGSDLMGEHIFNILNNSRQAVEGAVSRDRIKSGEIEVIVSDDEDKSNGVFVAVCVRDNGGGVDEDLLSKVGEYGFTTKGLHGTGFGVAAARDYFDSLGGGLTFRNAGMGFEVIIRIPVYAHARHDGAMAISGS